VIRYLAGFARFWWDFLVGDDWRIAAGVLVVVAAGAVAVRTGALPDGTIAVGVGLGIVAVAAVCIVLPARRGAGSG
jgi:hypothetical protein